MKRFILFGLLASFLFAQTGTMERERLMNEFGMTTKVEGETVLGVGEFGDRTEEPNAMLKKLRERFPQLVPAISEKTKNEQRNYMKGFSI